jgi:hypothetical protein
MGRAAHSATPTPGLCRHLVFRGAGGSPLPRQRRGDPHGKRDALSAADDRGRGVDGMCGGIICGLREGGGYLSWQNGRIAYVSYDGNGSGIYTSNPNGSGKIAFESERDGNSEIYTMNPNGMSVDRLTNNPAFDFEPDWHLSRPQ